MKNRLLIYFMVVSLAVIPLRSANSALPALALVSARAVTAAGAVTEVTQLSGLINTIGIAALMFSFSNGKSISLQVANPAKGGQYATPVPEPAAPPTQEVISNASSAEPYSLPVGSVSSSKGFYFSGTSFVYPTLDQAIGAYLGDLTFKPTGGYHQNVVGYAYVTELTPISAVASNSYCSAVASGYYVKAVVPYNSGLNEVERCIQVSGNPCSPGYFYDSGECVLDDPYLAQKDNHTELLRSSSSWSPTSENDADPLPESVRVSVTGDKVTFPVTTPDGKIKTIQVSISGDPYPTVRLDEFVNLDPSTVVRTSSVFDELGILRESLQNQQPGQITEDDPYSVSSSSTTNPGTGTGTTFQFPTDYARVGEAAAAANVVKASVDSFKGEFVLFRTSWEAFKTLFQTLHEKITGTTEVQDPAEQPIENGLKAATSGLTDWSMPAHSGACPTPSVSMEFFGGRTFTMNSHCEIAEQNRDLIGSIMRIMFAVMAVFIVLGA